MKTPLKFVVLMAFIYLFAYRVGAQMVNNGANLYVGPNAVLAIDASYINHYGAILNKGEITISGDWENNDAQSNAFHYLSSGLVKFTGRKTTIYGAATTSFPRLAFRGNGLVSLKTDVDVLIAADLGDVELKVGDQRFTLSNYDAAALTVGDGFVSTGSNGALVRYIIPGENYIYPMGSAKLGVKRFVGIAGSKVQKAMVGVTFVDRDPNADGYDRLSKTPAVALVNYNYYHVISQVNGNTLPLDISFYTSATEKFDGLANWGTRNQWDKLWPLQFKDNTAAISIGMQRMLTYQNFDLTGNAKIPFAFANVSNSSQLNFYNAFSPDGDGKNDTWEIKNIDAFPDNDLKIFDRSGNLIYRAVGYNSSKYWDGQNAVSGTYFYVLRIKIEGKDEYYKGSITMVKN